MSVANNRAPTQQNRYLSGKQLCSYQVKDAAPANQTQADGKLRVTRSAEDAKRKPRKIACSSYH